MSRKRRAYSYLRFSSPAQAKGDSFKRQTTLAANYARTKNLELDELLTFHDLGVSAYRGVNSETGQLNALLEAVKSRLIPKGSVILVESLDRISRQSARKALRIFESIVETGVSIVTISDGREYTAESLDSDPLSFLMAILTFIRANEESNIKSQRIAASWATRRKNALKQPLTSICPGWMYLAADRKSFILIDEHVKTVERVFREVSRGESIIGIVRRLNSESVSVPRGGARQAPFWQPSTILYLINNRATTGTLTTRQYAIIDGKQVRTESEKIEGYYPAIISASQFEEVQALRQKVASSRRREQATYPIRNIIGGLTSCGHCGSPMMLSTAPKRLYYLVCRRVEYRAGCIPRSVRYGEVERSVLSNVISMVSGGRGKHPIITDSLSETLRQMFHQEQLDRPEINKVLKSIIERIVVFPERGEAVLKWRRGGESVLHGAFTPTTKRWNRYSMTKRDTTTPVSPP